MKKKNYKNMVTGFTLLETIVAIFVLMMAVTGAMTFAGRSIASATASQKQISAFFLATEAIDFIRNRQDTNFWQGNTWLAGLDDCFSSDGSKTCYVDVTADPPNIQSCSGECPELQYDEDGKYFNYADGIPTGFRRTIKIIEVETGVESKVEVKMEWPERVGVYTKNFVLEENIFDSRH